MSEQMNLRAKLENKKGPKGPKVDTAAAYNAVYLKYKAFLDVLRKEVNVDSLNRDFIEKFSPEPGTVLFTKYDPSKVVGSEVIAKQATNNLGQIIDYAVIMEKYTTDSGAPGMAKFQGPICQIDMTISQFGPSPKMFFRNGNVYDQAWLDMWEKHYNRELQLIVERGLVRTRPGADEKSKLDAASGALRDPVYVPIIKGNGKVPDKIIEGADKSMFLKLLNYTGNRTNFMFPNGFKVPFEDFYGVTVIGLPIIRVNEIHIGAKPSSQRNIISVIIYDVIESRGMTDNMVAQQKMSQELVPGLKAMDGVLPDMSIKITPPVITEEQDPENEQGFYVPTRPAAATMDSGIVPMLAAATLGPVGAAIATSAMLPDSAPSGYQNVPLALPSKPRVQINAPKSQVFLPRPASPPKGPESSPVPANATSSTGGLVAFLEKEKSNQS